MEAVSRGVALLVRILRSEEGVRMDVDDAATTAHGFQGRSKRHAVADAPHRFNRITHIIQFFSKRLHVDVDRAIGDV